jgi:hypothetical protein
MRVVICDTSGGTGGIRYMQTWASYVFVRFMQRTQWTRGETCGVRQSGTDARGCPGRAGAARGGGA